MGYGKLLIEEAVGFPRKNKLKIFPTCEFAKKIRNKYDNFKDITMNNH